MDRREAILVRLLAVCQGIAGIATAERGLGVLSDNRLPVLALLDGAEQADDTDPTIRPNRAPRRVIMSPQLVLAASAAPEDIGTTLNGFRALLIPAITTDAELLALTLLGAGGTRYQGCALALDEARDTLGSLTIDFSITYVLRPDEL